MLFNSLHFLFFFPVVTACYYALPHGYRWILLLAASCYFYMAFVPAYILILLFTITVDYAAGLAIERSAGRTRRLFLFASLAANVGVLAVFKYLQFLTGNLEALARFLHWNYSLHTLEIILPIGLSFHTFQAISYTIEVYRRNHPAERHIGLLALYVLFYPQLVAGPIERPGRLLPQLRREHAFDYEMVTDGLKLMLWGFFKKVVIADRLALLVGPVYDAPADYPPIALVLATLFFAWQIYCDFSGYSDIAVGAAQVMGFTLTQNFRRPYFSGTLAEFWHRWHISLSTWFRDYVYIPLGGSRTTPLRWQLNVLAVFLLSGLWHGANWTFVAWGGLHGVYLVASIRTRRFRADLARLSRLDRAPGLRKAFQVLVTVSFVSFAWIFFRAGSLAAALAFVRHLLSFSLHDLGLFALMFSSAAARRALGLETDTFGRGELLGLALSVLLLEGVQVLQERASVRATLRRQPVMVRWALYYGALAWILTFGEFGNREFIYFQF